jgi:polyketide biosynthesis enoyl-CoA hydratase PksH
VTYETIHVQQQDSICFLRLHRPVISDLLVEECADALSACESESTVVVLEGLPEVFCLGADLSGVGQQRQDPEPLYDLWLRLATGPFVTVAHVRGKANAGGLGFVAASDVVIADESAEFSLSELLFGLMPACVLPFLVRRVGFQRAHYMTLTAQPLPVQQAHAWQLVDAYAAKSEPLLRRQLARLRHLNKASIASYKDYMNGQSEALLRLRARALAANRSMFADPQTIAGIVRFTESGLLPWQQ